MRDIIKYIIIILVVVGIALVVRNMLNSNDEVKEDNDKVVEKINDAELYKISVIVLDSESKKSISGAVVVVRDSNNNIIEKWTSSSEKKIISNLKAGDYILEQISSIDNYNLSDKISFSIVDKNLEFNLFNSLKSKDEIVVNNDKKDVPVVNTLSDKNILNICFGLIFCVIGSIILFDIKRKNA